MILVLDERPQPRAFSSAHRSAWLMCRMSLKSCLELHAAPAVVAAGTHLVSPREVRVPTLTELAVVSLRALERLRTVPQVVATEETEGRFGHDDALRELMQGRRITGLQEGPGRAALPDGQQVGYDPYVVWRRPQPRHEPFTNCVKHALPAVMAHGGDCLTMSRFERIGAGGSQQEAVLPDLLFLRVGGPRLRTARAAVARALRQMRSPHGKRVEGQPPKRIQQKA